MCQFGLLLDFVVMALAATVLWRASAAVLSLAAGLTLARCALDGFPDWGWVPVALILPVALVMAARMIRRSRFLPLTENLNDAIGERA